MRLRPAHRWAVPRVVAALLALALVAVACGGDEAPDTEPPAEAAPADDPADEEEEPSEAPATDTEECEDGITARASHHLGEENSGHEAFLAMAEEIEDGTEGRITVEVFPAAQLGGLGEMVESLRSGTIELAWLDSGSISGFVPEVGALSLPFVFETDDQFHDLIDGDVGQDMNALILEEAGVEVLFWSSVSFLYPFFAGDIEVRSPDDFEGLTMRTAATQAFLDTMRAFGAEAVDLPLGDVYTALQTGQVDGSILPYWAYRATSLYEVSDTLTSVGVVLANIAVGVDPQWLDGLCASDAEVVRAAAATGERINREGWPEEEIESREYLVEQGITMVDLTDEETQRFFDAATPVLESWEADVGGELWERMKDELGLL